MESSVSVCLTEFCVSDLVILRIDRIHFIGYNVGINLELHEHEKSRLTLYSFGR